MKVAIMQPTYLPWSGYFDLMDQVDVFVLLDTVQFSRQSWQQRNRVKSASGPLMLTVPVRQRFGQSIREVETDATRPWASKHLKTLRTCYARAAHGAFILPRAERVLEAPPAMLCELDRALIDASADALGIRTKRILASELELRERDRVRRLLEIARAVGADTYLSPRGAAGYIADDTAFREAGIALEFQRFEHPTHAQLYPPFVSHLSVVDLLANVGPASLDTIRQGRRPPMTIHEALATSPTAPREPDSNA